MHLIVNCIESQQVQRTWEEIQIEVPWGIVAGKWYGDRDQQPVLALHGWQDNAGTFDKLIPLLPACVPILAIDLPGHGLSSHYPTGMVCLYAIQITILEEWVLNVAWLIIGIFILEILASFFMRLL